MKTFILLATLIFTINVQATVTSCSGTDGNGTWRQVFFSGVISCGSSGYDNDQIGVIYNVSDVDGMISSLSSSINANSTALSKKIADLQERTFVMEEALQKEIQIPDSVIKQIRNDIKKELKAELKDELKAEILKELNR